MISLCNDWEFTPEWSEAFLKGEGAGEPVRLPHNVKELPLHYAGPEDYELVCGYRRKLAIPESWRGKRLFLQFDGAAHGADVYINGIHVGSHRCGYTAFRLEVTDYARFGGEMDLAVKLDTRENPAIPPFGFVIDYLTYGGLYREAWLDVREESYITDVFVTTPATDTLVAQVKVCGTYDAIRLSVLDGEQLLVEAVGSAKQRITDPEAQPWTVDAPKLYTLRAELLKGGAVLDRQEVTFGYRTAEFRADGFYLNGEKLFLRGLNRHQSYPYIGYAAPERLQREDARILKQELQCNAVRTSHYPQSQHFIDACDRLGLLVFTELPGWQHIGDRAWKEQALENLREMVLQYRNHPSIILWGVRINESVDDDAFYTRANALAHALDPSRATSGVRYLEKSHLLEDVYAYNDFSHNGLTPGAKKKKDVTPDMGKALLISEHNGHMFPTKSFDPWEKRQAQALRHARVLSAAQGGGEHAGCFGWCMFDYATHKDFGSGDRVCYHGVMDSFRNPKLAAAVYASQGEDSPVLELGCPMDIGDYPAGQLGKVYAFTNADEVRLYKNDVFVAGFQKGELEGLNHNPILIDDTIGALLKTQEGFPEQKAELLRRCLVSAGKHGLANMPAADKARMLWCMLRYHMSMQEGVDLYGKYVGNWGGEATRWRFDAVKNGRVVASQTRAPGKKLRIEARPSHTTLTEGASYDMAAVRVRLLDEWGNVASFAQLPLHFSVSGPIALAGPDRAAAEGGMGGCYIKTTGMSGVGTLTISVPGLDSVSIEFEVNA
ncbi:MAG: glycoside hydrolase family 2 protein [Oscillospiraceae bacterium]|nr:glycoside hydrolase family 2 protein [Oscillospiraceae bacterium]